MNTTELVRTIGYVGIFAIIFAETGLLIGFFVPGNTLLISAGLLAARGQLSLPLLLVGGCVAAVLGDTLGYVIGRATRDRPYHRSDSIGWPADRADETYHAGKRRDVTVC